MGLIEMKLDIKQSETNAKPLFNDSVISAVDTLLYMPMTEDLRIRWLLQIIESNQPGDTCKY